MSDGRIVPEMNEFAPPVGGMFFIPRGVDGNIPVVANRIPNTSVPAVLASSIILTMPVPRF